MSDNEGIFRQTVSEADIDWLFCIELNSSESFRRWVGKSLFPNLKSFQHVRAWRSVSNSQGESDLIWVVDDLESGRHMALIENKINAVAQPEQYQRYVERGKGYIEDEIAQEIVIALLSPAKYRSMDSGSYPINITYESVVEWLKSQGNERFDYLRSIYEAAIEKRISANPVDEEIFNFRMQIWTLANDEFPELKVPHPGAGGGDYWVFMRHTGYTLIYKTFRKNFKFTDSVIDLELAGRGEHVEALKQEYEHYLNNTEIEVVQTEKSASFRVNVPTIEPPMYEEEKVRVALKAASSLKEWWDSKPT